MSDLKAQQLAHLSKEIKLDAVQPVIKKAKRSIAELSAATTAAQTVRRKIFLLRSHNNTKGSNVYRKALGSALVGSKLSETALRKATFDLLKSSGRQLSLEAMLEELEARDTPHREHLNAFLRTHKEILLSDGRFSYRGELSWVRNRDDLLRLLLDSASGYLVSKLEPLYEGAAADIASLCAERRLLRATLPEVKGSKDIVTHVVANHFPKLTIKGVTAEMQAEWRSIAVPDDPVSFERAMTQANLPLMQQEAKVIATKAKAGSAAAKSTKKRKIQVQNTHLADQFDFNSEFRPEDQVTRIQRLMAERQSQPQ
jgi:hypothetical protein